MKKALFVVQGVIQLFVGLGGLVCGVMFMIDTTGQIMMLPGGLLEGSPFPAI